MDITKCENEKCIVKENCLRYLAEPNPYWQSYSNFECNKENNWKYKIRVNKIRDNE